MKIEVDDEFFEDALSIRDILNSDQMNDLEKLNRISDYLHWQYDRGIRHGQNNLNVTEV